MLRASLARAFVFRQVSTSTSVPNTTRPRSFNDDSAHLLENQRSPSSSQSPTATSDGTLPPNSLSTSDRPNADDPRPTYDLDFVKQRLREWSGQAAITVRNRADDFTANTKTTLSQLGLHLNKVTGYEAIEALKRDVVNQGV